MGITNMILVPNSLFLEIGKGDRLSPGQVARVLDCSSRLGSLGLTSFLFQIDRRAGEIEVYIHLLQPGGCSAKPPCNGRTGGLIWLRTSK